MVKILLSQMIRGQWLASSRPWSTHSNHGLTLLELLVTVAIVGLLSAIAAPSLLGQATKARQTEAQINVGSILRAQQSFYMQESKFATTLESLELGITDSTYYRYDVRSFAGHRTLAGVTVNGSTADAIPRKDVRRYMGKVWLDGSTGDLAIHSVLCEGGIRDTAFMMGFTYCP